MNKARIILLAVMALGAGLRLYGLTAKPLWYDETGFIAHALKGPGFMLQSVANYKLPYIILLKIWINLFGIGAFATRILSVLCGVASIFLVYRLGKKLFNTGVALIASFLLSISPFHIYHSQQVKQYSFLTFLVLLCAVYFIDFLREKKQSSLMATSLLNILIVCTHPFGVSFVIVQFLYVIYILRELERGQFLKWIHFQLPLTLFLAVWARILIGGRGNFEAILWWLRPPNLQSLMDTFSTFCYGGPMYGLSIVGPAFLPPAGSSGMTLVYGACFMRSLLLSVNPRPQNQHAFVLIWLLVPIAFSFIFSYLFFPVYLIKDFLILLPSFCLIVASGVYYKRRVYSLMLLVIICLLNIIPLMMVYRASINVDWQKAVSFVKGNDLKKDDIIIMATTKEIVSLMYYLSGGDKAALKDVLIFGKFENGGWRESFRYKDHSIITLGSERNQGKDGYRDPGFGINKIYREEYITDDFDKKVMQQDIIKSNRQIWLLISSWAGDAYSSQALSDRLASHFKSTLAKEVGGIKIYRFNPRL